jgi:hypothetical protein
VLATCALTLALASPVPRDAPFPLRTDPPPKGWKAGEINEGLPLRWEKGTAHVLAWATVADDRPHSYTQVLVLKQFDKPTEDGGHRWVLTHLYLDPADKERPWRGPLRVPPPLRPGERMPDLTDAQLFGWEFYADRPTDRQVEAFLRETHWTPRLGAGGFTFAEGKVRKVTTTLAAGGVDPVLWKKVFARNVPARLFPELAKPADKPAE